MRLVAPWWLLLLPPAIAAVVWIARRGRRTVGLRQHRLAVVVRSVGVTLLVLALAQPVLVRSTDQRSVLFVLDRSASIPAEARVAQERFVADAVASARPGDLTAVAVFGEELRLDTSLSSSPSFRGVETVVGDAATDLETALRAGAAVLPTDGSRRIVVLTDGVETVGNARRAARELGEAGVAVDVVSVTTGRGPDALVDSVAAPPVVREGEQIPVTVRLRATREGAATLLVVAGEERIEVPVDLVAASSTVEVTLPPASGGVLRIQATVAAGFDTVAGNDRAETMIRVDGPPRVLVVEGVNGDGDELTDALTASGIATEQTGAVPDAAGLLSYDAVVLVNVPAPDDTAAADLASYVEELGRGLVVVGGDRAYGLGGYHESLLEDALPVTSDPDDFIRRQPVAEVLVIDTSGSMADCHCGGIGGHDASLQGGVNKTDISRAGAGLAIDALQETDRVGVLAFTSGTRWALPLETKPGDAEIDAALASLTPAGDTAISQALREALTALRDAPEEIKHMVLFTDGWGEDPDLLEIAQEIAAEGITLSVLGTGEGTGESLRRMAALGGGRFYPGRDLQAIPEVFVEETLRVARPLVSEGSFLPALGDATQVTAGLTAAPPLAGYVLTKARPVAQVPLEVGPGDPLLATWQRGLGRVTAWTSDATARWAADWVPWEGFVDFWGKVVRDVLPAGLDTPPSVAIRGGRLVVEYAADVALDAAAVATIRRPDGTSVAIPLERTGASEFRGEVEAGAAGAYWVAVQVEDPTGVLASGSGGVVAGYPDELAFREPDPALPGDLAGATGGRVDPDPEEAYEPAPVRGATGTPLWPALAALALALFLVDVALRRLAFSRGDLAAWREELGRRRRPVGAIETAPGGEAVADREVHPEEETLGRLLRRKRT